MKDIPVDDIASTLEEMYSLLLSFLPEELRSLPYETIVLSEELRPRKTGLKKYYVLRGYYYKKRRRRSKVLGCYSEGVRLSEVIQLVYLYRLVKYLDGALNYSQALRGCVRI